MIEVNNFTRFRVDGKYLQKLAGKILEGEKKSDTELSISLVNKAEIKRLNKKYRNINKPTDVLSFTYKNSGEIVISPQVVKENARIYGVIFKKELMRVLAHGALHALGYDHEKGVKTAEKMRKKEEKYLST